MTPLFGILHEPDVAITDWILALEVLAFAVLIARRGGSHVTVGTLIALMCASLLGGLYHGFFPLKTTTDGGWIVWIATMLSIGAASAGLLFIAVTSLNMRLRKGTAFVCSALFVLYAAYVIGVNHEFKTAILFYLPALLVFLAAMIARRIAAGILAILLMLVAAALQQMQIGLHPVYFNHNAVYHVIQFVALWLLFVALQTITPAGTRPVGRS